MNKSLFKNRNFNLLWAGKIVSEMGTRIYAVALVWWALEVTGSGLKLGIILAISGVPIIIFGPLAGAWVDRLNRKPVIVYMDIVRGIVITIFAVLAFTKQLSIWHIYVGVFINAVATSFFNPAVNATIPNIVARDRLTRANSLFQMTTSALHVLGPAVGGILVAAAGIPAVFLLNGISFFLSGLSEAFMKLPPLEKSSRKNRIHVDLMDGLRYVKAQKVVLYMLFISGVVNFFAYPVEVLTPALVKNVLAMDVKGVGFLWASWSLGMMAASIALSVIPEMKKKHRPIVAGTVLIGVTFILAGLSRAFYLTLAVYMLFGVGTVLSRLPARVLIQGMVPDEKRGRVFGLLTTMNNALHPLAFLVPGLLMDIIGVPPLYIINGAAVILGGVIVYSVREIRKF